MGLLTSKTLKSVLSKLYLFHIVDPSDTTDNPAGSSFKTTLSSLMSLVELTKVSFENSITANIAGTQAAATQLTKRYNRIDTATVANSSVKFLQAYAGMEQELYNNSANDIQVYPFLADKFLDLAINTSIVVPPGGTLKVFAYETLILS